jgi:hypothetical protein
VPATVSALIEPLREQLGMPPLELALVDEDAFLVGARPPRTLLLGQDAPQLPAGELRFLAAFWLELLRSGAALLCAASEDDTPRLLADLTSGLRKQGGERAELATALAEAALPPDRLLLWRHAAQVTASRVALLATGDLFSALGALARLSGAATPADALRLPLSGELVRFALEPPSAPQPVT